MEQLPPFSFPLGQGTPGVSKPLRFGANGHQTPTNQKQRDLHQRVLPLHFHLLRNQETFGRCLAREVADTSSVQLPQTRYCAVASVLCARSIRHGSKKVLSLQHVWYGPLEDREKMLTPRQIILGLVLLTPFAILWTWKPRETIARRYF